MNLAGRQRVQLAKGGFSAACRATLQVRSRLFGQFQRARSPKFAEQLPKKYAVWGMRLVLRACYGAAQLSLSERRSPMKMSNAHYPEELSALTAFLIVVEATLLIGILEMNRRRS